MTEKLTRSSYAKDELDLALQQILPVQEDEEGGVKSLTEEYNKYKREFVKHILFNPAEETSSK